MHDFLIQVDAELQAMGFKCLIHGPEVWLAVVGVCLFVGGFLCGLLVVNLLMGKRR